MFFFLMITHFIQFLPKQHLQLKALNIIELNGMLEVALVRKPNQLSSLIKYPLSAHTL